MKALVIGSASQVWDEVAAAKSLCSFDCVIAINAAGTVYPDAIDHWVSFHTTNFPHWIELRDRAGFPPCQSFWSSDYRGRGLRVSQRDPMHNIGQPLQLIKCEGGSSGLIAAKVALHLKATHVVLAGVPMDVDRGHFNNAAPWKEALAYRGAWQGSLAEFVHKVRSMSGWTAELLGKPTTQWLNQRP